VPHVWLASSLGEETSGWISSSSAFSLSPAQRIGPPWILVRKYGSVSKPCTPGEHQNSWDLWMFIPLKMVLIGIDPYPYVQFWMILGYPDFRNPPYKKYLEWEKTI